MASPPTICVITAATGHPDLGRCIQSVRRQSFPNVRHLLVVDGPEWNDRFDAVLQSVDNRQTLPIIRLPYATGKNTWNGHRIYGAMPSLAMTDFVCWLDEDNWFDPEHLESLLEALMSANAGWAFSLRKIVDSAGKFIALDQCESLGNLHPTILSDADYHIDTSCYLLARDLAIQFAGAWNRIARPPDNEGPGPDRLLCRLLMKYYPNGPCTRLYTLNYTVASTPQSVSPQFFLDGNAQMRKRYPAALPWEGPSDSL